MVYYKEVLRLRKENASLRRQVGDKTTDNSDLLGRRDVGGKELEQLREENSLLSRRLMVRDRDRAEAIRELENEELAPAGLARRRPAEKPDNSDIFTVSEEEFKRTGGM